jgi:site-specific recombinase XerD
MVRASLDRACGFYRLYAEDPDLVADANAFLEALGIRGLSPQTVRAYAFDLVTLHRWLNTSDRRLEDLEQSTLLEYIAHQQQVGAQPASINRRLTTCRLFYCFVTGTEIEAGPRGSPPAPHYRGRGRDRYLGLHRLKNQHRLELRVKTPHKLVEPLEGKQVLDFIGSLQRYRDLAIVYLMLFCGLRSREVLGMRHSDISINERRLRIVGKGQRERALPMPEVLVGVITDYLRLERPENVATDHLFVVLQGRRRGRPMTPSGLRSLFRHRRENRRGIGNANAHRFRHTFGSDMARAGVRLPILQKMMGHASATTTLQYINLSMADIAEQYMKAMQAIHNRYERDAG